MDPDIGLIDPKSNPAGIKGMEHVAEAFKAIKAKRPSLSRATTARHTYP
jgi:ABC-type tungstate transport system permease subunit